MRRCMDLQLMDYRNSSKCASALCFVFVILFLRHALAVFTCATGRLVYRIQTHRDSLFMYIIYGSELFPNKAIKQALFFRFMGSLPLMTTSTRTHLYIHPSRPPAMCWQAPSLVRLSISIQVE